MMATKKEWWETFFRGAWLDVQRDSDKPDLVRRAGDFIQMVLGERDGLKVLDAPCGEGRIARELDRRGYEVTGLDITASLIRDAQRKAKPGGAAIEYRQGDMRKIPWRRRFDACICWWGSFGYFSDKDNLRHARSVAAALKPGGRFIINTHSPETLFPSFKDRDWLEIGEMSVNIDNSYDVENGRIESEWIFRRKGRRTRARSSIRIYSLPELKALLRDVGFEAFASYGDLEGEAFELDSRRLLLVATKG